MKNVIVFPIWSANLSFPKASAASIAAFKESCTISSSGDKPTSTLALTAGFTISISSPSASTSTVSWTSISTSASTSSSMSTSTSSSASDSDNSANIVSLISKQTFETSEKTPPES